MRWQECFMQYLYVPLIECDILGERILDLGIFLLEGEIPDELQQIYLSEQKDELFFILRIDKETDVSMFCKAWDEKILAFINFGDMSKAGASIERLQYNIVQIVLCEDFNDRKMEKSISVSRKLFLECGTNDELDDQNQLLLPFWYEKLNGVQIDPNKKAFLNNLLPVEENLMFLRNARSKLDKRRTDVSEGDLLFSEEEFDAVKGWLEADDIEKNNN